MTEPDWRFGGLWPYEPRYFASADGAMHYVDEGPRQAAPVVMLHGNATWGFLYRDFIAALADAGHRAIAPDHLGFGRSEKPSGSEHYDVARHAARLDALLESLDLHDVTLVVCEWGASLGLAWAIAHPERVSRLFVLNSPPPQLPIMDVALPLPIRAFRAPGLGELMVKGLGMFTRGFLFHAAVVHPERLTKQIQAAYLAPHPSWDSRTAVLAFPRQIPFRPAGPVAEMSLRLQREIGALAERPARIVWGERDISFGPEMLEQWEALLPGAAVTRIQDAGHCIQEDATEQVVGELLEFLA
jgi:pimeloyl-ACP methyl ester carboxylesterase